MRFQKNGFALILTLLVVLIAASAQAMPQSSYLVQDDYTLTFGELGNPLAGGTGIESMGRIVLWNAEMFAGSFVLSGVAASPAADLGNQWRMNFNKGTFKITSQPYGNGVTLWEGRIDYFWLTGNKDDSKFLAATYNRPAYEDEPTEFNQTGRAKFVRTSGVWTDSALLLDWAGTYNINYDAASVAESSMLMGNLQGKLVAVPEPGGLLLMGSGLISLVGFVSRKRSR